MDELSELLFESVRPIGTRRFNFDRMIDVLEAGHAAGLTLFTVDVVTSDGTLPLPEWMFRATDKDLASVPASDITPVALKFYRDHASDPALGAAGFEVFFEQPE